MWPKLRGRSPQLTKFWSNLLQTKFTINPFPSKTLTWNLAHGLKMTKNVLVVGEFC